MSSQEPIGRHFTPVFYLSGWAVNNRVTRFYRPFRDVVASTPTPRYAGCADELYTLHGIPAEHRQMLETNFFSPVNSRGAVAHRLLLDCRLNHLTNDQRCDWARFLLSMQLRSPWALGELKRLTDQTLRKNMETTAHPEYRAEIWKPGDPETAWGWMEKYHPQELEIAHKRFLPALVDHEDLGKYLINMQWMTLDLSHASRTLLTCDRPFLRTYGWKDTRTTLLCPLSPRVLFVAANSDDRLAALRAVSPSQVVRETNRQIVDFAVDFVIGVDASQAAFVEAELRRPDQDPRPGVIGRGRPN